MKGQYSLHTTVVIMIPILLLAYLITNGEYPEILVNGEKLLEIILKQSLDIFNMHSRRMIINTNCSNLIKNCTCESVCSLIQIMTVYQCCI